MLLLFNILGKHFSFYSDIMSTRNKIWYEKFIKTSLCMCKLR